MDFIDLKKQIEEVTLKNTAETTEDSNADFERIRWTVRRLIENCPSIIFLGDSSEFISLLDNEGICTKAFRQGSRLDVFVFHELTEQDSDFIEDSYDLHGGFSRVYIDPQDRSEGFLRTVIMDNEIETRGQLILSY